MSGYALRQDQLDLKQGVYDGWQSGNRNMLAVLPTGGGKSVVVSDIVREQDAQGTTAGVIAHRVELVSQMAMHIASRGVQHRIIAPRDVVNDAANQQREELGRSFVNPNAKCGVAGIDTLLARQDLLKPWCEQVGLWVTDEGHHLLAGNKWGSGTLLFPNSYGLAVTATPKRADGMGLGRHHDGVIDAMVIGPDMRHMIDLGNLSDYEYVCPESDFEIDEDDIPASGDFSTAKMRAAAQRSHIVGDVVLSYIKYAYGKRGITFATDVDTAKEIAQKYNDHGIPAAAISAKTPSNVRRDYIKRFKAGKLLQLVNVDLFGEGFDVPAVEVVSMARPTASLAVYLQQAGRALRKFAGKLYGLIIDHVSNYKRHKFPDTPRFWTLDRANKRAKSEPDPEDIPLTNCKHCSKPYERFRLVCPYCGKAPPIPEPGGRSIETVDGDLRLLDRETLAAMRAAAVLDDPGALAHRTSFVAGPLAAAGAANRQIERIAEQRRLMDAIAHWVGRERSRGRADAESEKRFYLTLGIDPLSALAQPRADMEKIANKVESWMLK